ncbi:hypothetical protein [Treponema endosymbiont of Eucomonympha sp.]|uniref:hypothetical protein n=1 Tax=Treponema endosymbiont of Eucomonympha sp. TaxID=1580831 RepID=UPI00164F554C|nr:hypothetical protein [Treponema endosymbiont of Eucomonympha sp.]
MRATSEFSEKTRHICFAPMLSPMGKGVKASADWGCRNGEKGSGQRPLPFLSHRGSGFAAFPMTAYRQAAFPPCGKRSTCTPMARYRVCFANTRGIEASGCRAGLADGFRARDCRTKSARRYAYSRNHTRMQKCPSLSREGKHNGTESSANRGFDV